MGEPYGEGVVESPIEFNPSAIEGGGGMGGGNNDLDVSSISFLAGMDDDNVGGGGGNILDDLTNPLASTDVNPATLSLAE